MKRPVFTGAAVAIITPMNTDGSVNYDELGRIIDDQIAHSTDAIVICGTTGESPTLTDEEHTECIRYTVKKAAGRVPVIAGTGSNDTKYAIWLSKQAEADGADALLRTAVEWHSAFRLPEALDDRTRLFCQILRDADKIDILRVNVETPMEEIYNVSTAALRRSPVTPAVLDAFYAHHCVLHSLKQYPADNAVGHASLVFELCYPESLRIVDEQGWLWRLLDFKTDNPDTAAAFAAIRDELHRWLNAQSA